MARVGRPRSATSRYATERDFDELLKNTYVQRTVERRSINQDVEESAEAARMRRALAAKGIFTLLGRDGRSIANKARELERQATVKEVFSLIQSKGWQSKTDSWVAREIIRLKKIRGSVRAIRGYVADARKLARPA